VAQIRAEEAQSLLDEIAQGAKATTTDLIDAIRAAKSAVLTPGFRKGHVFVSTSGSGQSSSFLIPTELTAHYTQTLLSAQYWEFIKIYNEAVASGRITDATDVDSDLAAMLQDDRLQTVTRRRTDHTNIRFPSSFPA
jgi:hypothetical protein